MYVCIEFQAAGSDTGQFDLYSFFNYKYRIYLRLLKLHQIHTMDNT